MQTGWNYLKRGQFFIDFEVKAACTAGVYVLFLYFSGTLYISASLYLNSHSVHMRSLHVSPVCEKGLFKELFLRIEGVNLYQLQSLWDQLMISDYLNKLDLKYLMTTAFTDKWWLPAFFGSLKAVTSLRRQPWGWLSCSSMATLHTETSLCLLFVWCCEAGRILARPADFHCELFMVSLNGALMKNGDHFRPHCSCQILLLGTTFI